MFVHVLFSKNVLQKHLKQLYSAKVNRAWQTSTSGFHNPDKQATDRESCFPVEKAKASALTAQIASTDREIGAMVYALYGLTDEEVAIVENA